MQNCDVRKILGAKNSNFMSKSSPVTRVTFQKAKMFDPLDILFTQKFDHREENFVVIKIDLQERNLW